MSGRDSAPFHALVTAYFVSGLGTAMSAVAIPWLVLTTTGSAAATGLVGFAQMAPYVVLQATAGPLVDRVGLRRTFLVGNTVAAVMVGAVPLLDGLDALSLGVLVVLVAIAGAARGIADAATTPLVPATAASGEIAIERATGVYSAANRTAMLAGMPLAGVLVAAIGAANVLIVDAVSFLAAVVVLATFVPARVALTEKAAGPLGLRAYVAELGEGMRFIAADRLLLGIAAMVLVTNLLDEALTAVLIPVWAHDRVHRAEALGLVGGALGFGLLLGVVLGAWLGPRLPRWATFAVGSLVSAAPPFFALAAWSTVVPVLVIAFACGVAGGVMNPIIGAVQFERVPPRLHTRVLGALKASAWLGIPFGSLAGGLLVEHPGLTPALLIFGSIMLVATFAPFVFPSWRELDRRPEVHATTPAHASR